MVVVLSIEIRKEKESGSGFLAICFCNKLHSPRSLWIVCCCKILYKAINLNSTMIKLKLNAYGILLHSICVVKIVVIVVIVVVCCI